MSDMSAQYREHGYAVLESVIPAGQLDSIRSAAMRIVEEFDADRHRTIFTTRNQDHAQDRYFLESAEAVHCFLEEGAIDTNGRLLRDRQRAVNKIGHALHDLVPEFRDFCRQPLFREVLSALGADQPALWQTMYIFKQPGIGGEVRWHQDATYLHTLPPSVTGLWIAVEEARMDNGCLWVQPGGHRSPLREIYEVDHQNGDALAGARECRAAGGARRQPGRLQRPPAALQFAESLTPLASCLRHAFRFGPCRVVGNELAATTEPAALRAVSHDAARAALNAPPFSATFSAARRAR